MESIAIIIFLVEFDTYYLELEYLIDHIINGIYNSGDVILIGDNITLLYYKHQFIGSLHVVNSKSWTRTLFCCYLHRMLECS